MYDQHGNKHEIITRQGLLILWLQIYLPIMLRIYAYRGLFSAKGRAIDIFKASVK